MTKEDKKDQLISELLSMGIYKQKGRQLFQVPYEELLKLYQENRSYKNEKREGTIYVRKH